MLYRDMFLKYSTKELNSIYKSLPNTKLGNGLKREIKKAVMYHNLPNVFMLRIDSPSKRLSNENIDKGFSTLDYLSSYLVKNKNGLKKLSGIFDMEFRIKEYPTIVDIYYSDRTGFGTYECLSSRDGHVVNDKLAFVLSYYNAFYKRDIRLEVNNAGKFEVIDIITKPTKKYNVFNKPISRVEPFLVVRKKIKDKWFYYLLNTELELTLIESDVYDIKLNKNFIVLRDVKLSNSNKIKYRSIRYKSVNIKDNYLKELFAEFKDLVNLYLSV